MSEAWWDADILAGILSEKAAPPKNKKNNCGAFVGYKQATPTGF